VTGNTGAAPHLGNIELKHIFDDAPRRTQLPSLDGKPILTATSHHIATSSR
jgi:hypothetical protein